ncbi:uncharacterized protein LOC135338236 [Halichondria panicea]|uniref:uncharacterized protein LOC135338236 n=1 Tax=Halichondria panicea TaxID=6063 RepID=UPI00312B9F95
MAFWRSLVPVLRTSLPSLREVSVSGTWTRCCNRMLSGTGGDEDSHNDDPKFFIDEETMKIISPGREVADPRDIPVFLGDSPAPTTHAPSTPAPSRRRKDGSLPVVRMRLKNQWHQKLPIVHIKATYNNTIYTITDCEGKVLAWSTAGSAGFKNARRGTTFAAQSAAMAAAQKARQLGFQKVQVLIKGPGPGRQPSIKGLEGGGLQIVSVQDVTPVPHNGCRPRKARRL